jgi:signal transduction histidine kinase
LSTGAAQGLQKAQTSTRSPLEQLLHALNQPLTGLQCSMEVALASPRTVEYYAQRLRESLELTERMRALVKALREVTDLAAEKSETSETVEFQAVLQEVLADLAPVAEAKGVRILAGGSAVGSFTGRQRLFALLFRLLESALSLADTGSAMRIETEGAPATEIRICIRWLAGPRTAEFSRAELGLLVAQAGWEGAGAKWERTRADNLETVTLRVPKGSGGGMV